MLIAPAKTGKDNNNKIAVINTAQTNTNYKNITRHSIHILNPLRSEHGRKQPYHFSRLRTETLAKGMNTNLNLQARIPLSQGLSYPKRAKAFA